MQEQLIIQAKAVITELTEKAKLKTGDIVVIGCSTSEIIGSRIGTNSSPDTAKMVFEAIYEVTQEKGVYLAAQCCEHLNRAIIIERQAVPFTETVNAIPQPKAGGSFATAAYKFATDPVAIEEIKKFLDQKLDRGCTLFHVQGGYTGKETFALQAIFVPRIGYMASAASSTICYLVIMLLSYFVGRSHLEIPYDVRRIGIYTLLVVTLLAGYYALAHFLSINEWIKMGIGTILLIIYCVLFYRLDGRTLIKKK